MTKEDFFGLANHPTAATQADVGRSGLRMPAWTSLIGVVLVATFVMFPQQGYGHALEQSYVFLSVHGNSVDGRIEIGIADLNTILDSELPTDKTVTIADLEPYLDEIRDYVSAHVAFAPEGAPAKSLPLTHHGLTTIKLGQYFVYYFTFSELPHEPNYIDVDYTILFDIEPQHRAMLVVETNWRAGTFDNEAIVSLTFAPGRGNQRLDFSDSSVWRGFTEFVRLGVHHIWIGIDHILFLIALLLPSVVRRTQQRWAPVSDFRPALIYAIKVVTIFTVAHTITLSLAALNTISMPSRLVESVIALSIAIAALDVIYPVFRNRIWIVVFAFGLFHGFGFASVLGEIGIPPKYTVHSLLGFNVGVELGQLAIVCLVFPILYLMRAWRGYTGLILRYGSIALIAVSLYWFVERGFGIDLPAGAMFNRVLELFA